MLFDRRDSLKDSRAVILFREHRQFPSRLVLGASGCQSGHGAPPGRPGRRGPRPRADARALTAARRFALGLGADGVMVPFRPEAGAPTGKTRWREIKVGVLARLSQHRTRTGQVVTRLAHRRLVAVLGDIEMLTPLCGLKRCARVS